MANGEVVFEAPWQGRVFGMARLLCEQGLYEWDEFRAALIEQVDGWDRAHESGEAYEYFDLFLAAFTGLLARKQVCDASEIVTRTEAFAARPHGHDH